MNRIFILLVLSLFAAGCSPVSVQTQGKVALDPVKMKATYAWLEKAVPSNDIRVKILRRKLKRSLLPVFTTDQAILDSLVQCLKMLKLEK